VREAAQNSDDCRVEKRDVGFWRRSSRVLLELVTVLG
jgi:hypothetical protein